MNAGSVTGAAEQLHISQPSVSKMLKHLESRLGFLLFKRIKGRIVPTQEAHALHHEVERVYRGLRSIQKIASEMRQGKAGRLNVAATTALGLNFMPRALSSFHEERPNIHYSLMVRTVSEVEELVASQQIDIGLVLFPYGSPTVESSEIARAQMVCVVPEDHPLGKKSSIRPSDLQAYPLISFDRIWPFGRLIEKYFHKAKLEFEIAANVELCSTACSLVLSGAGIAIVDEFTAMAPAFPNLKRISLVPPITFGVTLLSPMYRPKSIIAKAFIEHLSGRLNARMNE